MELPERNGYDECAAPEVPNVTNEANAIDEPNATNEPTAIDEIVTNEATVLIERTGPPRA